MVSEKIMEDAISSEPEKYLGEKGLRLVARQYSIGSYVFDLLFEDRHGARLIFELQKGTLDRNHTYKILDYYDEYKEKNPNAFIELMVIANKIPYERRKRLDSHGISWKEIPESEFSDIPDAGIRPDKNNINLVNNREINSQNKVAGGYGSVEVRNKKKIIPDIYDKIGSVLRDMRADRGTTTTFTSSEVYPLYVERYPDDEEFMEKLEGCTLKEYVPGMVWEYSKKADGLDPDRPAIEFLGKRTYRFV
jgi:hypothetical protein